jgi:hypothetical protein
MPASVNPIARLKKDVFVPVLVVDPIGRPHDFRCLGCRTASESVTPEFSFM